MLDINLKGVPFSIRGSYWAISYMTRDIWKDRLKGKREGLYLRNLHACSMNQEMIHFDVPGTREVKGRVGKIDILGEKGKVSFTFDGWECIRVRSERESLKIHNISESDVFLRISKDLFLLNLPRSCSQIHIKVLKGKVETEHEWNGVSSGKVSIHIKPENGIFELEIFEESPGPGDFEKAVRRNEENFKNFLKRFGLQKEKKAKTSAVHILWSSTVRPFGNIKREAVLMSKNWMNAVWSWDHTFNALALSKAHPELAWNQLKIIFDHQKENGKIPDFVNDAISYWNFVKPPIHGWILSKMMENIDLDTEQLKEAYEWLSGWTEWWLSEMDYDGDGVPQYNHGNDSGWDNSTVFLKEPSVESPDLSSYLILQMETLANLAEKLGMKEISEKWNERSKELLSKMKDHFIKRGRITAVKSGSHEVIDSKSLLPLMSILVIDKFSEEVRKYIVNEIEDFVTPFGLATEKPTSEYYEDDGYWRGPTWAPPVFMVYEGFKKVGQLNKAQDIANRFLRTVEREGFAENFDSLKGKGLRDRTLTWTASVYIVLSEEQWKS